MSAFANHTYMDPSSGSAFLPVHQGGRICIGRLSYPNPHSASRFAFNSCQYPWLQTRFT